MYELINIFDTFLPQLLLYPNPSDPLNPDAAKLLNDNPDKYNKHVIEHVKQNASKKIILLKVSDNNNKPDYDLKNKDKTISKEDVNKNNNSNNKTKTNGKINKLNEGDENLSELSNASIDNNDLDKDLEDW